jgi:uncharacterized protein
MTGFGSEERPDESIGPVRRCLVSGRPGERGGLVRFVLGPVGEIVPDVEEKLPGRGFWVSADRATVETARRRHLFAKAARASVVSPDDLADRVEALLVRRCQSLIGLALRSRRAVFGCEKVREWLEAGKRGILVQASDGALHERRRIAALGGGGCTIVGALSGSELGAAIGRHRVVHGLVLSGKLANNLAREAARLAGFRATPDKSSSAQRRAGTSSRCERR